MRVMVFGAGGMLGRDLQEVFAADELFAFARKDADISDFSRVRSAVSEIGPDVVVNAAAFTRVDDCESQADEAYRHNALGVRNLAAAAEEQNAALVQISTDYVFAGDSALPYREYDATGPQTVYGQSKLAGERLAASLCHRHFIVRTAWLYGLHGNNFVETMIRLGRERGRVAVVNDQTGSPTFTRDLAAAVSLLARSSEYGVYHISNQGACTWFDFARDIFSLSGMRDVEVSPQRTEDLSRPAPRPRYSVLDNQMWRLSGRPMLRHYREALAEYLALRNRGPSEAVDQGERA